MKKFLSLVLSALLVAGCGGGGSDNAGVQPVPQGTVSGTTFDGLILHGTIQAYDFSTGRKGALLASGETGEEGLYSLSLRVESRPVWIEVTGGYYAEEASNKSVSLTSGHKLAAVVNYTTGATVRVAVTTYSYIAAGLAQYQIARGTGVASAINNANTRISTLVGVNILTTTPKEITDVRNASATLTPELRYGFLTSAISMWTYLHPSNANTRHEPPNTSIDFAQLAYQDIAADGVLDGFGLDSANARAQLSFGTTPLSVDVYRLGLGVAMLQMADDENNVTGLNGSRLLQAANAYAGSTDPIFNNVAPVTLSPPTVAVTSPAANAALRREVSVTATTTAVAGVKTVELLVDGTAVGESSNLAAPTVLLNSTTVSDGVHTLSMRTTDFGGQVTRSDVSVLIDNTAPTAVHTSQFLASASGPMLRGTVNDGTVGSGVVSVRNLTTGAVATLAANGTWELVPFTFANAGNYYADVVEVKDRAGNCSRYNAGGPTKVMGRDTVTWTLLATDYAC